MPPDRGARGVFSHESFGKLGGGELRECRSSIAKREQEGRQGWTFGHSERLEAVLPSVLDHPPLGRHSTHAQLMKFECGDRLEQVTFLTGCDKVVLVPESVRQ